MTRGLAQKFTTWFAKARDRDVGWTTKWTALIAYGLFRRRLPEPLDFGERHPFSHDWDVLVVLDACRPDLMAEVAAEYPWLDGGGEAVWSVGSNSEEWLERTFSRRYQPTIEETVYVTGNPHSEFAIPTEQFEAVDEVWKYAWDDELGTVPPRPITDAAISRLRDDPSERTIVHYMQPHFPSISDAGISAGIPPEQAGEVWEDSVWDRLRRGEVEVDTVWSAYRDNLDAVLDDVALLRENVDADTLVVTSDHGNALGEFGFYGHHGYLALSCLRRVPWYETSASDSGEYVPATYEDGTDGDVMDRLEDLGYTT